jgi:hypothetical protein
MNSAPFVGPVVLGTIQSPDVSVSAVPTWTPLRVTRTGRSPTHADFVDEMFPVTVPPDVTFSITTLLAALTVRRRACAMDAAGKATASTHNRTRALFVTRSPIVGSSISVGRSLRRFTSG